MRNHLILYDGTCGLCDHVVQFLLKVDTHETFVFAPLQGKTAKRYLSQGTQEVDSVVLVENYQTDPQIRILSQAALRMLWLLGGPWVLIGWLSFLPAWLFDWAYKYVARHRYQWVARRCLVPPKGQKDRFLN